MGNHVHISMISLWHTQQPRDAQRPSDVGVNIDRAGIAPVICLPLAKPSE